jgi:hypothetical protein
MTTIKNQILTLNTLKLGARQSSLLNQDSANKLIISSQTIIDIKKEFIAFKQNVLQELERQKILVNQLVKEVLTALEV